MSSRNYLIHDLIVRSQVALSLPAADGGRVPDIEVTHTATELVGEDAPAGRLIAFEANPPFSFYITETHGGFIVRYGGACDLAVARDGAKIEVTDDRRAGDIASVILAAGGIAFAAMRKGHSMFHASGVALDGEGIIALGDAGRGKTTLAAELAFAGAAVLGDDAIRVDIAEGGPVVFPGSPVLRLRPGSAAGLRSYLDHASVAAQTSDGRLAVSTAGDVPARVRLSAVLVSCPNERRTTVEFERLDARAAFIESVRHVRTAGFTDGTYLVDHFVFSSRLVERVPFYRLHRPPWPMPPADVRACVEELLCR